MNRRRFLCDAVLAALAVGGSGAHAQAAPFAFLKSRKLRSKVGSFSTGTGANGTQIPITGVGFQPKVVFFWWSGNTEVTDTTGGGHSFRGFGSATSASSRFVAGNFIEDAQATEDSDRVLHNGACVARMGTATNIDGLLDLMSMDSDGFTLIVDDNFSTSMRVHYLALGGPVLTDATIGFFQEAVAPGDQDITDVGFRPDCVMLVSAGSTIAPPSQQPVGNMNIGAATATAQAVLSGFANNGIDGAKSYSRLGQIFGLGFSGAATTMGSHATLSSFLSNGFRLNWSEVSSTRQIAYIALKGGKYNIGGLQTRTDSNDILVPGLDGAAAAMFFSHGRPESVADVADVDLRWSVGAASAPSQRAAAATFTSQASPSVVSLGVEHDAVYLNINPADTLGGTMDLISFNPGKCAMDDPDPSAAFVWFLAFGSS